LDYIKQIALSSLVAVESYIQDSNIPKGAPVCASYKGKNRAYFLKNDRMK
jgi:hypothetical protein